MMSKLAGVHHASSSVHATCCTANIKAGVITSDGCFVIQRRDMLASYGSKYTQVTFQTAVHENCLLSLHTWLISSDVQVR